MSKTSKNKWVNLLHPTPFESLNLSPFSLRPSFHQTRFTLTFAAPPLLASARSSSAPSLDSFRPQDFPWKSVVVAFELWPFSALSLALSIRLKNKRLSFYSFYSFVLVLVPNSSGPVRTRSTSFDDADQWRTRWGVLPAGRADRVLQDGRGRNSSTNEGTRKAGNVGNALRSVRDGPSGRRSVAFVFSSPPLVCSLSKSCLSQSADFGVLLLSFYFVDFFFRCLAATTSFRFLFTSREALLLGFTEFHWVSY